MSKLPFMKFFPNDWLADPSLQKLSLEAKGFWIELTCYLWSCNPRGIIIGTYQEIGNLMGIDKDRVKNLITLLKDTNTATVTICNSEVTIISRRMQREESQRLSGTERVRKHRADKRNYNVTNSNEERSDVILHMSDNIPKNDLIEAEKLATYFEKYRILENGIDTKEFKKWAIELYKLVKIDKESWNEVERVIRWVLNDDFWKTVVHSPLKFRRKDKEGIRYWDKFKQLSKQNSKGRTQIEGNEDYNENKL